MQTETSQKLYHEHAAKMPIIDYHCHLIPQMVAEDYQFKSLTEIWLGGDHYKWRAMRTNGVDERFCTGKDTTDWEKFEKWAETVPYTFRNPLYHWTHLELKTAFGIDKILNPHTAREIYDECNEKLKQPEYSARGMMRRYHVEVVCTTDDPIDSLEYHIKTRESGFEIKMLPTWRPDKAMAVEVPADFRAYVEKLAEVSDVAISCFDDMVAALRKRHDFFAEQGCKLSDHGIEEFYAEDYTEVEVKAIFNKVYGGTGLTKEEILKFKSAMLVVFGEMDWEKGWTQQFHYGAIRNNNSKMFKLLGPDTGFDSIGEFTTAKAMAKFLDRLNSNGKLTKTILYNLNPCANEVIATMLGNSAAALGHMAAVFDKSETGPEGGNPVYAAVTLETTVLLGNVAVLQVHAYLTYIYILIMTCVNKSDLLSGLVIDNGIREHGKIGPFHLCQFVIGDLTALV